MVEENVATLPIWKKNATAYERLSELALLAREKPERFQQFVIVYKEITELGRYRIRTMEHGGLLVENVGLLEIGKSELLKESEK